MFNHQGSVFFFFAFTLVIFFLSLMCFPLSLHSHASVLAEKMLSAWLNLKANDILSHFSHINWIILNNIYSNNKKSHFISV